MREEDTCFGCKFLDEQFYGNGSIYFYCEKFEVYVGVDNPMGATEIPKPFSADCKEEGKGSITLMSSIPV